LLLWWCALCSARTPACFALVLGAALLLAGPAGAGAIFDPADLPAGAVDLDFASGFSSVPSGTDLNLNSDVGQGFEDQGIRFFATVYSPVAGQPFADKHVGGRTDEIRIEFNTPARGFGLDVKSGVPAQGNTGLTFRATYTSGATETFQFPCPDPSDSTCNPSAPSELLGPPFNSQSAFAGFVWDFNGPITMVEIFHSAIGAPNSKQIIAGASTFPRVGDVTLPSSLVRGLVVALVPEPNTALLLGIGLAAVAGLGRRRQTPEPRGRS
jgi:hypothetical protein